MSAINLRMACSADVLTIHSLIAELAAFEREPEAFVLTPQDLLQHGFEQSPPLFEVVLAESPTDGVLGMAMVYTKYSSWRGPCLFFGRFGGTTSTSPQGGGQAIGRGGLSPGR